MTDEKRVKTTKADLDKFKKEFLRYQKLFGLTGWDVRVKTEELSTAQAQLRYITNDCNADVVLGKTVDEGTSIKELAKHEAIHLLLARYDYLASYRYITAEELIQANEEVTVKLTDLIP